MKHTNRSLVVNPVLLIIFLFITVISLNAQCNCNSNLIPDKVIKLMKNAEQLPSCASLNINDVTNFNSGYIPVNPYETVRLYFEAQSSAVPAIAKVKLFDESYNVVQTQEKSFEELFKMNQNSKKFYFIQAIPENVEFIQIMINSNEPVSVQNLCVSSQNNISNSF